MGLFSVVFGQPARTELAKTLASSRIAELTNDQIDEETQFALLRQIQSMGMAQAMSLPEGTIVTIVHSYSELIKKRIDHVAALTQVEQHRASLGSRNVNFREMSLDDYVAYRLSLELPGGPSPGMDDYWLNLCMSECSKHCQVPWNGGPTHRPRITRRAKS